MTVLALLTAVALADQPLTHWASFRNGGPSVAAAGEYPLDWSPGGRNVAWHLETRGYGQSAPVVAGDRVFLTAVEGPKKETGLVMCLDLASGDILWTHEFLTSEHSPSNYMNARAAPTPVVDGERVVAWFETGDLVALSHAGEEQWRRSLTDEFGPVENHHGLGASPAQDAGQVFVNVEHDGPSYLIAVDKATGETAWKVERPSGKSWSSPVVVELGGRRMVAVSSAGTVDAYDAADGQTLWSVGGIAGNSIPSPSAAAGGLLVGARIPEFGEAADAAPSNLLLRMDGPAEPAVVWRAEKAVSHYASPVAADGHAYFLSHGGVLAALEMEGGRRAYRKRLGVDCWATPVVAGGRLYFFGRDGMTKVVRTGSEFEVLAENRLWPADAPPAALHYTEAVGGHGGHGSHGGHHAHGGEGDHKKSDSEEHAPHGSAGHGAKPEGHAGDEADGDGRPAGLGGFAARLLRGDADNDGRLSPDELPETMGALFGRLDKDGSGFIDTPELIAMEQEFRKKRENARNESRDPIVYGVAAAAGTFVVRTGTHVYALRSTSDGAPVAAR